MFRKNIMVQYKLYIKNLQSLKERRAARNLQICTSAVRNVKEKCIACCSIAHKVPQSHKHATNESSANEKFGGLNSRYVTQIQNALNQRLHHVLYGTVGVTAVSTTTADELLQATSVESIVKVTETSPVLEPIPEPPPVPEPDTLTEVVSQLNALGEPTLTSLGLGNWTPVGLVQNSLEYLHVAFDIPWWASIAIGTVVIRLLMFPLVVVAQRNAAKMNNYMPQLQALQLKMTEARQTGNQLDAARYSQEMMIFMKEKDVNPLKNMIVPLAQMPVFLSMFMALRQMANLPVQSMRNGGMFWFTDLTVPDQYFALPILTSFTLWITIEIGTDTARLSAQNMQVMQYVLRALPVIILPFTVNFPGSVLCYWVTSNFVSLLQVGFLRVPAVRDYFGIQAHVKHNPENLPIKNKGFVGGIKDSWTNIKITRAIEERKRYDELQFQRAGRGPVVKTYKYDPTKQATPSAMNAKKR